MIPADFCDLHQHVLWGLDDGPQTPEQMYALLQQNVIEGIHLIFATTHAYPKVKPFNLELYRQRLNEADAYCEKRGWPLYVIGGCEIHYCSAVSDLLSDGLLPTLGSSRQVLIEFDSNTSLKDIGHASDKLYRAGFLPVVAHVERIDHLMHAPERAITLRDDYGLAYQMNCETAYNPNGLREKRFVKKMLDAHAIDAIATDAHDVLIRPAHMKAAYQKIAAEQGADYANQLVSYGWQFMGEEGKAHG